MSFDNVNFTSDSKVTRDVFHHDQTGLTETGQIISACGHSKVTRDAFHHDQTDLTETGQIISVCGRLLTSHFRNFKVKFNKQQTNNVVYTLT